MSDTINGLVMRLRRIADKESKVWESKVVDRSVLIEAANEVENLEKQLAERDAALARCVEALQKASYALFQIKRMVPEAIKEHAIKDSDAACEVLNSLPTSAQATAKVLAAARWVPCDEQMPDLIGRDDIHVPGGAPATLYSERVLVFDGIVRIDNLVQAEGSPETRTFYLGSRKLPVTHWMPLPEPPEAVREEQETK